MHHGGRAALPAAAWRRLATPCKARAQLYNRRRRHRNLGRPPRRDFPSRATLTQVTSQRVRSRAELDAALSAAGSRVVMLEVVSDLVCDLDAQPRPEAQWKDDGAGVAARMAPCVELRSGLQRGARDCPDVAFLSVNADEQPERAAELGVTVLPTVQFWRNGARLWQTEGAEGGLQGSGEAVLYFGDYAADGVRASDFVRDVADRAALDALLAAAGPGKLAVLNVSLATATPCVKIFPAFMALAKHLASVASFGRLIADGPGGAGAAALSQELDVSHTPAFLFFRDGVEVGRHVGSSRGDVVGKILEMQGAFGVPPPPPPPRRRTPAAPPQRRASGQAMWR